MTGRRTNDWVLPLLLVLNGVMSVLLIDQAQTLRRAAQIWDLRLTASDAMPAASPRSNPPPAHSP
jgi:hypothetical protein